jgi:mercuric ion transport protein
MVSYDLLRTCAMSEPADGRIPLIAGGFAAVLTSACCLGPLLFVSIGLGGAWLANLTALEPYSPFFLAVALVSLGLAWRRIFRPAADCAPGEVCAIPAVRRGYKTVFWIVVGLVLLALAFPLLAPVFY